MGKIFVTTEELTAVADKIRAKGGTSAPLTWPDGYIAAIENISGGTDRGVPYLAFWCDDAFAFSVRPGSVLRDGRLEYSTDLVNWSTWDGTAISSAVCGTRHLIALRGVGNRALYNTSGSYLALTTVPAGMIDCEGDLDNLLDYEVTQAGGYPARNIQWAYCFFMNWSNLRTPPALGSLILTESCYNGMFYGCTGLTTAPALPATTLAARCYSTMFYGCTSLIAPPGLPASAIAQRCYSSMFSGCSQLSVSDTQDTAHPYAWRIPTTDMGGSAYQWSQGMLTGTAGPFVSDPVVNTTYYTVNPPVTAA